MHVRHSIWNGSASMYSQWCSKALLMDTDMIK